MKAKKRIAACLAVLLCLFSLTSCEEGMIFRFNLKIGVVIGNNVQDAVKTAHLNAIDTMVKDLKLKAERCIIREQIASEQCYATASALAEDGCKLIFAIGPDFEDYVIQTAQEHPKVQFCVANGTKATTEGQPNLHNYWLKEYESRYLAGMAAGLILNDRIENGVLSAKDAVIGYVGSAEGAESISAYSAFYLGAKAVCPTVFMKVKYVDTPLNGEAESVVAAALIANGCKVIAQQSAGNSAADICGETGTVFIANTDAAVAQASAAAVYDWTAVYRTVTDCIRSHHALPVEWSAGASSADSILPPFKEDAFLTEQGLAQAKDRLQAAAEQLVAGTLHSFDLQAFTVNGTSGTELAANDETAELANYLSPGGDYFMENTVTAAPQFALAIDGITVLD